MVFIVCCSFTLGEHKAALLFMRWTKCCGYLYTIRTFWQYLLQISCTWHVVSVTVVVVVAAVSNSLWFFFASCLLLLCNVTLFLCYTSARAVWQPLLFDKHCTGDVALAAAAAVARSFPQFLSQLSQRCVAALRSRFQHVRLRWRAFLSLSLSPALFCSLS